jgi:hypothetical protein
MATTPNVQFRAGQITPALAARACRGHNMNDVARRDLARYYSMVDAELRAVELREAEAGLILDACRSVIFDETNYRLLWAEVQDAIQNDALMGRWDVDGAPLVAKLQALTPGQRLALVDAIERALCSPDPRATLGVLLPLVV